MNATLRHSPRSARIARAWEIVDELNAEAEKGGPLRPGARGRAPS